MIRHACSVVGCKYPDRSGAGDLLQYASDYAGDLGFGSLKIFLTSNYNGAQIPSRPDYPGQTWGGPYNGLVNLVQDPAYADVLGDPRFSRFFIDVWSFALGIFNPWINDVTTSQLQAEYTEWYELAGYLLTTYPGKTFVLQSGAESDWLLLGAFDPTVEPPPYRVERYAAILNTHQRAVQDARRDVVSTATVLHAVEVNRVLDDYGVRMHRDVFPLITVDTISYTAYEGLIDTTGYVRTQRNPGFGADISGAAHGNGAFVLVGTDGNVSRSTNGTRWTLIDAGFGADDVNAVAFADGVFVAVGDGGKLATSADGLTWTQRTTGTVQNLNGVFYQNGFWVTYGNSATVLYSIDLASWSQAVFLLGGTPTTDFVCAAVDLVESGNSVIGGTNGKIVYGGPTTFASNVNSQFGTDTVRAIGSSSGYFVAVGDGGKASKTSYGGAAPWTSVDAQFSTSDIACVGFANGTFVAAGADGKLSTSTDGTAWTSRTSGTASDITALTHSTTEDVWAFGTAAGTLGTSVSATTWHVFDAAVDGAGIGTLLGIDGFTVVAGAGGKFSTAAFFSGRRGLEASVEASVRKALRRIKKSKPGTPIYIGEYAWPQDETWLTSINADIGALIQIILDVADEEGVTDVVWWQIFDNEEQSPGVPRGFSLYDRDGNATTPGPLNAAGIKYQALLNP